MNFRHIGPVFALIAALAGLAFGQQPFDNNPVVVTVNDEEVHAADIGAAAQGIAATAAQGGMNLSQEQIIQMATSQVIDATLLAQEARRLEIQVEEAQIDAAMAEIEKSAGGKEGLTAALGEAGMNYGQLRESMEKTLLARAYVDAKIRPNITVNDEEVEAFYQQNPEMFAIPEQVKARHILIKAALDAPESEVNQAKARAEAAHARAVAGEDFATLAQELSEGPSAPRGGDLGWISAEQTVEPFTTVAFSLEPGSISTVVKTRYGFHVILVEDHRDPSTQPLADIREDLRLALIDRAVGEQAELALEGLRENATIVPVNPTAGGQG